MLNPGLYLRTSQGGKERFLMTNVADVCWSNIVWEIFRVTTDHCPIDHYFDCWRVEGGGFGYNQAGMGSGLLLV